MPSLNGLKPWSIETVDGYVGRNLSDVIALLCPRSWRCFFLQVNELANALHAIMNSFRYIERFLVALYAARSKQTRAFILAVGEVAKGRGRG